MGCSNRIGPLGTVLGQNGSRQNGTDRTVWTKQYTDKMVYGQNGADKMAQIKWYDKIINQSIPLPLTIRFFHQSQFHLDPVRFPLCVYLILWISGY